MAVRQYIGARYVPKLYGAWRSGISYEPLTVVTYLNRSFTSKMTVPASVGNPADNDQYWVETGAYNAQVAAVQDSLDDIEANINAIDSQYRHVVIICDSYGTHNGAGAGHEVAYNILDRLNQYLGWTSVYLHYSAQNGAGFCNGAFLSQLNNVDTQGADEAVKDVYVLGGWNDEQGRENVSQEAFETAAAAFKTAAFQRFPNAKLHLCFAAWSYQSDRTQQDIRATLSWYKKLKKTGWIFEENYQYVMHNSMLFIGGNVHPNQDGVDALADALGQIILNGECHVRYDVSTNQANMTFNGTTLSNTTVTIYQTIIDGLISVNVYAVRGSLTLSEATSLTCDGNSGLKLFDYTGPTLVKGFGGRVVGNVVCTLWDGTNRYEVPGKLRFLNGEVTFIPDYYFEGQSYRTITGIIKVSIPACSFTTIPY